MMVAIRPARRNEQWAIRKLIWQVGINPFGLNWRRFWVAVDPSDEMLGCVQGKPHGKNVIELASLAVKPDQRGKGIAAALIRFMQTTYTPPIFLMCESGLVPLYEKFKFIELKEKRAMPAYFRSMVNLLSVIHWINPNAGRVAIMAWEPQQTSKD